MRVVKQFKIDNRYTRSEFAFGVDNNNEKLNNHQYNGFFHFSLHNRLNFLYHNLDLLVL